MDRQIWDALVETTKNSYATGLSEGSVPRPAIMPLVRGEVVGLIRVGATSSGQDPLTGIAQLSNIAAAAGADEVVLAWETHEVATACQLPVSGPTPCLNMVHATKEGHVLHQLPYTEEPLPHSPGGQAPTAAPQWLPTPDPEPGGELVPPIQAAVNYSFIPLDIDHPSPFGVTVVLMEEDGYTIHLTDTLTP